MHASIQYQNPVMVNTGRCVEVVMNFTVADSNLFLNIRQK